MIYLPDCSNIAIENITWLGCNVAYDLGLLVVFGYSFLGMMGIVVLSYLLSDESKSPRTPKEEIGK